MSGRKPTVKPGVKVQDSGIYQDGNGKKATMVKGEPANIRERASMEANH